MDFPFIHTTDPWLLGLLEAGLIVLLTVVCFAVSKKILKILFKDVRTLRSDVDESQLRSFTRLFRKTVIIIGASFAITSLPLSSQADVAIRQVTFVVIACFVLAGLFNFSNVCGILVRKKAPEFETLTKRTLKIAFASIMLMVGLQHFNYSILHILTALGVGSLAVGLAAQPTLTNMIAGFTILIDRPFKRGDRISLTPTETGQVVSIGMRSTQILNADGNILIVSNADLVGSRVINFDLPTHIMLSRVKFYLSHDTNLKEVKSALKTLVDELPGIVKGSPNALLSAVYDWGVEVTTTFNVDYYADISKTTDAVIDTALSEFKRRGVKLAVNPSPSFR